MKKDAYESKVSNGFSKYGAVLDNIVLRGANQN